jgi:hypothetical protein
LRLYLVTSIIYLEKYYTKDLFNYKSKELGPVYIEGDINKYKLYKIKKIIIK